MEPKDKELLAGFHQTISEQLNSRLSESPKFFGLLVIISTGYGYVLSQHGLCKLILPATVLALAATLWASWYLAALGYAFRFLQHSQHLIEHELQWRPKYVPISSGPSQSLANPLKWFGLLPGIYHAHAAGLIFFFVFISFIGFAGSKRFIVSIIGVSFIISANLFYLWKFHRTRRHT
jgi:hypothetical protein